MNELFRVMVIRPPQAAARVLPVDMASVGTPLQRALMAAPRGPGRIGRLASLARTFLQQNRGTLVTARSPLQSASALDTILAAVRDGHTAVDLNSLRGVIQSTFGKAAEAVTADPAFLADRERVWDSLLLSLLVPEVQREVPDRLSDWVHANALVGSAGVKDAALDVPGALLGSLSTVIQVPEAIFPPAPERLRPVGTADLLVVRQSLKGYELGDVSHIENVLSGESKKRALKHTLTVERSFTTETETTKEEVRDLQTTDRFELKREAETTQKEDQSLKAGVSVTAKYGTTLEVKANADYAYSNSKTEAEKQASDYSHNVVDRAAKKVTERTLERSQTTVTEVFDETDEHGLVNPPGANVTGVYQWVNKVYEAQVLNYGQRLLFDVVIPEPAAFLLDAATRRSTAALPEEPAKFELPVSGLSETPTNPGYYSTFVALYRATGIEPPPPPYVTTSKSRSEKTDQDESNDQFVADMELKVPDGYVAADGWVTGTWNYKSDDPARTLRVTVGNTTVDLGDQTGLNRFFTLNTIQLGGILGVGDTVPVGVVTKNLKDYEFTIVVRCERRDQTFTAWQLKTHAAIQQAYVARVAEYQAVMKGLQFTAAMTATIGGNPMTNRAVERAEIKKSCIGFLAGTNIYDLNINDITEDPPTTPPTALFPRPDLVKTPVDAKLIRFFEQAFEWENITYLFYPYFWGRSSTWYEKALMDNVDPLFAQFLAAGAARVVVPVRPSFEDDVRFWVDFGQPWMGGEVPGVSSPDYLPIAQEIRSIQGASGNERPVGLPWPVKLPTTLVKLRSDGKLPEWIKVADPDDPTGQRKIWVAAKRDAQGNLVPDLSPA